MSAWKFDDRAGDCRDALYDVCCSHFTLAQKWVLCFTVWIPLVIAVNLTILYVNPKNPEFSVEQFYVPAFNKTYSNSTTNTISFDIKLLNKNSAIGLYYDAPVNVTLSFIPIETNKKIIWTYSVPKFYQGNGKSRILRDAIQPLGSPDMPVFNQTVAAEHSRVLPSGAMTTGFEPVLYFRVDIVTKFRFKLIGKQEAKDYAVAANVPIGTTTGEKFAEDGITASAGGRAQAGVMVVLGAVILIFM